MTFDNFNSKKLFFFPFIINYHQHNKKTTININFEIFKTISKYIFNNIKRKRKDTLSFTFFRFITLFR